LYVIVTVPESAAPAPGDSTTTPDKSLDPASSATDPAPSPVAITVGADSVSPVRVIVLSDVRITAFTNRLPADASESAGAGRVIIAVAVRDLRRENKHAPVDKRRIGWIDKELKRRFRE
jgi:hypothetical protein